MICALCKKDVDELINSHLLPAAAYAHVRGIKGAGNESPVKINLGVKKAGPTDKQVRQYLLCADCEDLFSRNGEKHLGRLWATRDSFPLLDILNKSAKYSDGKRFVSYDGSKIDCRIVSSIFYFAVSVFWRAHVWEWGRDGDGYKRALGDHYSEAFRKFLLTGEALEDVYVLLELNTDGKTRGMLGFPSCCKIDGEWIHTFIMLGLRFSMYVGKSVSATTRAPFIHLNTKLIFISSDLSVGSYFHKLAARVQADENFRQKIRKN